MFLMAYTYFLYPVLLFCAYVLEQARRDFHHLLNRRDRRPASPEVEALPPVSLIVPAYDEEAHLLEKIRNTRQLEYAREKLEVIFVSDGSTDRTNEILRELRGPNIQTIFLPVRHGKCAALNHAVACATHEILVFSDAATLFAPDAVTKLVRHFSDPRVGAVCGSLMFRRTEESQQTEGFYWKYESILRLMEARLGATLTASGAIYALRRQCYKYLADDTVVEDFVIPMRARQLGHRVLYDPEAVGTDIAASSVGGEFARRVRLAVGSFRALSELSRIPLHAFTCLAFFSHKLLRWVFPFLQIGLLISNGLMLSSTFYLKTFVVQLFFYFWAGIGYLFRNRMVRVRYGLMGYFLFAMHLAFLVGFFRFLAGRGEVTWQRVN